MPHDVPPDGDHPLREPGPSGPGPQPPVHLCGLPTETPRRTRRSHPGRRDHRGRRDRLMGESYVVKAPASPGRTGSSDPAVAETVATIIEDVRARGDAAVRDASARLDNWSPESFRLSGREIARIIDSVPQQALDDIDFAQRQVRVFARHQRESLADFEVETMPG